MSAVRVLKAAAAPLVFVLKALVRGFTVVGLLLPTGPMPVQGRRASAAPAAPPDPALPREPAVACPVEVVSFAALSRDEQLWEAEMSSDPEAY